MWLTRHYCEYHEMRGPLWELKLDQNKISNFCFPKNQKALGMQPARIILHLSAYGRFPKTLITAPRQGNKFSHYRVFPWSCISYCSTNTGILTRLSSPYGPFKNVPKWIVIYIYTDQDTTTFSKCVWPVRIFSIVHLRGFITYIHFVLSHNRAIAQM